MRDRFTELQELYKNSSEYEKDLKGAYEKGFSDGKAEGLEDLKWEFERAYESRYTDGEQGRGGLDD